MARCEPLTTAAWHGDQPLPLEFPEHWRVTTWWPDTPAPLSDAEIAAAFERPIGQAPIRELAYGRSRPLVIVDDLTRPTPAGRVLPVVLRHLADAGVPAEAVRILVGTGTHGPPSRDAMTRKVGPEAASSCRLLVHDHTRNLTRIGRTSFGTPVVVNREVLTSDLLIGVGGVYPQHTTGFGGGSKLALSVLGKRSIVSLHYGHPSMEGSYEIRNDFRRDLDEISRMIGLATSVSLHVDASRRVVRVTAGDPLRHYQQAVEFSLRAYRAPLPGDADVVVSNAYPIDVSLTFMRSKGITPLLHARPGASRVLLAACSEGVGHHGLFPFPNGTRFQRQIHLARKMRVRPRAAAAKAGALAVRRVRAAVGARRAGTAPRPAGQAGVRPILLYVPGQRPGSLPAELPGMTLVHEWADVLARIGDEQGGRDALEVVIYPCAPLQVLDGVPGGGHAATASTGSTDPSEDTDTPCSSS
jgi:nickel-dependent lactate racemase